jgi:hypothetical protein
VRERETELEREREREEERGVFDDDKGNIGISDKPTTQTPLAFMLKAIFAR